MVDISPAGAPSAATPAEPLSTVPSEVVDREPRGFRTKYFLASTGLFLATFAPTLGGLAVKIQSLVPLSEAGTQLGLVTGIGGVMAMISQPLVGRLSDRTMSRFGMRKPWILGGTILTFLALLIIPFAPNMGVLIVAWCLVQLFFNAAMAGLTATVADQVPEARRGRVSGLVGATGPIGIIIGAFGLSALPNDTLRLGLPALAGLILGLYFAFTLKDRILRTRPAPFSVMEFLSAFVFNPFKHRNLGWAWITKFMFVFGYASTITYSPLYLAAAFQMTNPAEQLQFNFYLLATSVVFNVAFAFIGGWLSDKFQRRRVFVTAGAIILAIGVALFGFGPLFGHDAGLVVLLVAQALLGIGGGLFLAVDIALCLEILPDPDKMARDLGVLNLANLLPASFAPLIAGLVMIPLGASLFGGGGGYSLWFVFAAFVSFVGGLLVYRIKGVR